MVNPVRLSLFFADEARISVSDRDERAGRGEYVISDYALDQVDWELNFAAQRMAVDAVLSGV